MRLARQRQMSYIRAVYCHAEQYDLASEHEGWSLTMPRSRSHQPNSEFTTTSMKLRGEIRDVLLPKITHIDMLKQPVDDLTTSDFSPLRASTRRCYSESVCNIAVYILARRWQKFISQSARPPGRHRRAVG